MKKTKPARPVKKKKFKIKGPVSKYAKPFNPESYRILTSGLRGKLKDHRILEDTTADISQYEDIREPQVPGKTIRNPFKAYPWR
jgi:hypothetical protein